MVKHIEKVALTASVFVTGFLKIASLHIAFLNVHILLNMFPY